MDLYHLTPVIQVLVVEAGEWGQDTVGAVWRGQGGWWVGAWGSCTAAILAYTIDMSVVMTASSSARDMKWIVFMLPACNSGKGRWLCGEMKDDHRKHWWVVMETVKGRESRKREKVTTLKPSNTTQGSYDHFGNLIFIQTYGWWKINVRFKGLMFKIIICFGVKVICNLNM